jgi:hypothetical protein
LNERRTQQRSNETECEAVHHLEILVAQAHEVVVVMKRRTRDSLSP